MKWSWWWANSHPQRSRCLSRLSCEHLESLRANGRHPWAQRRALELTQRAQAAEHVLRSDTWCPLLQHPYICCWQSFAAVVQVPSLARLFATLWTASCQASLSLTISPSLPKFTSIELGQSLRDNIQPPMVRHPLLLPLVFPSMANLRPSLRATSFLELSTDKREENANIQHQEDVPAHYGPLQCPSVDCLM